MNFLNPLQTVGQTLRETFLAIPLPWVKVLFVAIPLGLMAWVLRLPAKTTTPPEHVYRWDEDLRVWAWAALALQVVIYCVL